MCCALLEFIMQVFYSFFGLALLRESREHVLFSFEQLLQLQLFGDEFPRGLLTDGLDSSERSGNLSLTSLDVSFCDHLLFALSLHFNGFVCDACLLVLQLFKAILSAL